MTKDAYPLRTVLTKRPAREAMRLAKAQGLSRSVWIRTLILKAIADTQKAAH
jgi:hypothetical protein